MRYEGVAADAQVFGDISQLQQFVGIRLELIRILTTKNMSRVRRSRWTPPAPKRDQRPLGSLIGYGVRLCSSGRAAYAGVGNKE